MVSPLYFFIPLNLLRYSKIPDPRHDPEGERVILTRETVVVAPPEYSPPGYSSQPTVTQPSHPAITRQPATQQVVQDIGRSPVHIICPSCSNVITTKVSQEPNKYALNACVWMFICGYAVDCSITFLVLNAFKNNLRHLLNFLRVS